MFILQLMDSYVSSWSVFMMAALESVIVGWIYGRLKQKAQLSIQTMLNNFMPNYEYGGYTQKILSEFF